MLNPFVRSQGTGIARCDLVMVAVRGLAGVGLVLAGRCLPVVAPGSLSEDRNGLSEDRNIDCRETGS
jgi:hypothetical protein